MNQLTIQLAHGKVVFAPGDTIQGQVRWEFDRPPEAIDLVLFWRTESDRAQTDTGTASRVSWDSPGQRGERPFSFSLPEGPHSFSGKLIRLRWAVEAIRRPGKQSAHADFVLSPTGAEIQLPELAGERDPRQGPLGFRP